MIQLEGLALRAYPDYRLVDDILPTATRLVLSSRPPGHAPTSLLYELLYEGGAPQQGGAFAPEKLRSLLATAAAPRPGDAGGVGGAGGGGGGGAAGGAVEDLWGELLRAEGARELVADEAASVLDALARDLLWRAADAAAEATLTPPLPPLPLPLPLPLPRLRLLPPLPPLRARAEALAPRLSAEERLVLARLPEALAQIAPRSRPESTQVAGADGAADGETGRAAVPRGGVTGNVAAARVAAVPGVRDGARRLLEEALVRQDPQARATVERVVSGLRSRLRTRLGAAGADGAAAEAVAALLRVPWSSR